MRIAYFDIFGNNDNDSWVRAFNKLGTVTLFNVKKVIQKQRRWERVKRQLLKFVPEHIHLGGSIKYSQYMPILPWLREQFIGARITVFYGDAYYSTFHYDMLKYVDTIYTTNSSHKQMQFMVHPSDPEVYYPVKSNQQGVVFVGNNTHKKREKVIKRLVDIFGIHVYGIGWTGDLQFYKGPLALENYSEVMGRYDIVLGDPSGDICLNSMLSFECRKACRCYEKPVCQNKKCPEFSPLRQYLSTREINIMMCGGFCLTPYKSGLETLFTNGKHLVWYHSIDELHQHIRYYLFHHENRIHIGKQGRQEVLQKYTFDIAAKRLIDKGAL